MEDKNLVLDEQQSQSLFEQTIKALDHSEGCQIEGTIIINKVPGNFHLSTHAFGDIV
jgi:hypothetical protein